MRDPIGCHAILCVPLEYDIDRSCKLDTSLLQFTI